MKNNLLFVLLLLISVSTLGRSNSHDFRIIFYNTENLFDTKHDSLKSDTEFLPDGERFWTNKKFNLKLNRIFQTVIAAGEGNTPTLIGFCEVENRNVIDQLLYRTPLGKMGYKVIHKESPDRRGIDVVLLYNEKIFHPINYNHFQVINPKDESFKTREILYAKGVINSDTLHVFVNHWPSKYGGTVETIPLRALAAETLKSKTDSIFKTNQEAKIVIMGDFNDTPFDESISEHLKAQPDNTKLTPELVNLSYKIAKSGEGSHKYHGKWSMIDQMIVSDALLNSKIGLSTQYENHKIFSADFLLENDATYLGKKPFRTYIGFKYHNGFSDHLPVILDLDYK